MQPVGQARRATIGYLVYKVILTVDATADQNFQFISIGACLTDNVRPLGLSVITIFSRNAKRARRYGIL